MDLHLCQVESEAEITASNNKSLPWSLCQEQLAERTPGVTYHQHRERLKLWKQRRCCLPATDKQQGATQSQHTLQALPGGGGGEGGAQQ